MFWYEYSYGRISEAKAKKWLRAFKARHMLKGRDGWRQMITREHRRLNNKKETAPEGVHSYLPRQLLENVLMMFIIQNLDDTLENAHMFPRHEEEAA